MRDNIERQDKHPNLQLVYVYIEDSYSGVGGIELQLCNGTKFRFVRSERDGFLMKYYFIKKDATYMACADDFFDPHMHLKRIDVLVGENGTGKTTILNTISGMGPIGSWIELFYSYENQEYYFYSNKNVYIPIEKEETISAEVYIDNCKLKEIDLNYRKVFLHANEYQPEFLWNTVEQQFANMMQSDYKSVGRFLFQQKKKKQKFGPSYGFAFEIGLLAKESDIPKVIQLKQKIIQCLNNHAEREAIYILEELLKYSVEVLVLITAGNNLVSEEELKKQIKILKRDLESMIQCLHKMADKNGMSITTHMQHDTSYLVQKVSAEREVSKVNVEIEIGIEGENMEALMMNFLGIMDRMKVNSKIHQFQLIPFQCGFRAMSSGELAYLKLYSEIYFVLERYAKKPGILLLLFDEPETYMHPEWSRKMISNIVSLITDLYSEHCEWIANVQLLITTHTPYLLSDLLPCFITCLKKQNKKIYIRNGKRSFAANLYDILNSNFFVSNPIGEFAISKLNEIMDLKDGEDVTGYKELIENIGDEYLRKELERILGY